MSIGDCVSGHQRQIICNLIRQQQMKKASITNKDIYEEYKGDNEFWQRFANNLMEQLINSKGGYCEDYSLSSKGLIQGIGYDLEFTDSYNKEKFIIRANGNVEGPMEYIPSSSSSGGCYVATCVYGSYDCPQVWTLRRFRDYTLEQNPIGRFFIKVYYAISPMAVKWFGHYKCFHNLFKKTLDKWVKKLNSKGFENTPYND